MDLTKLSLTELESLAYKQIVERDRLTNNLQIIQAEIIKRQEVKPEIVKEDGIKQVNPK